MARRQLSTPLCWPSLSWCASRRSPPWARTPTRRSPASATASARRAKPLEGLSLAAGLAETGGEESETPRASLSAFSFWAHQEPVQLDEEHIRWASDPEHLAARFRESTATRCLEKVPGIRRAPGPSQCRPCAWLALALRPSRPSLGPH